MADVLKALGLDRYDRDARLKPALLCFLPIMLVVAIWLPKVASVFAAFLSLVATCGVTYFLAQVARHRGRQVQTRHESDLGGRPSAIALRHRDPRINAETKRRYHAALAARGVRIPSAEEEANDPRGADAFFRSASDWLVDHTRHTETYRLLLNENIGYGFRRNLLGLKPLAVGLLLVSLVADALAVFRLSPGDANVVWEGAILGGLLLLALLAWIFIVDDEFVHDASWAYATRLLAACETLPSVPATSQETLT